MTAFVRIRGTLVTGTFNRRPNRFTALVSLGGREVRCFLPNPGRMEELLVPNARVVLREVEGRHRKTYYDLVAIYDDGRLVSIDSRVPNRLLSNSLSRGNLEEFSRYTTIKPEYRYGQSRFDFLLTNNEEKRLMEVKSCTLVRDGVALFPDAPTARGRRHLLELAKAKREGYRACVVFIVQRTDVDEFSPND